MFAKNQQLVGGIGKITPKGPLWFFLQYSDFGQHTTNGLLFFSLKFSQHVPKE